MIEEIKAFFYEPSLIESPFCLTRITTQNDRYYFYEGKSYPSVTAFTSKVLPASEGLTRFFKANGVNSDVIAQERADYGTLYHILCSEFLIGKEINLSFTALEERVAVFLFEQRQPYNLLKRWVLDLQKDVLSFAVFCQEREVKAVGVEFPIISEKYKLGSVIDIVCKMTFNSKNVYAIIDIKSGKKGFWDSHKLQLALYKEIWNETYKSVFPITHTFNFAPKKWEDAPTYSLENQTNKYLAGDIETYHNVAKMNGLYKEFNPKILSVGKIKISEKLKYTIK